MDIAESQAGHIYNGPCFDLTDLRILSFRLTTRSSHPLTVWVSQSVIASTTVARELIANTPTARSTSP
jgi:hypothetical protein